MLAVIELHPETSSLGYPFRWDTALGGRPLLLRSIEAIARSRSVTRIVVVVPEEDPEFQKRLGALLPDAGVPSGVKVSAQALPGRPVGERAAIERARRLAPNAWRAGWAIPFAVAERGDPRRLAALGQRLEVDSLLVFSPAAPFVSAELIDELAAAHQESSAALRLSTLVPGLSGDLITTSFLGNIETLGVALDTPLRFLPDVPERDLDSKGAFHWYRREQTGFRHRLTAEGRRSLAILENLDGLVAPGTESEDLLRLSKTPDAAALFAGPVPAELRLRLTNRLRAPSVFDLPDESVAGEDFVDPSLVKRLAGELGPWQEVKLTLSGGEPTFHPEFYQILETARTSGIESIVVETDGLDLGEQDPAALRDTVDVLSIRVDAVHPETYAKIRGADRLAELEDRIERLIDWSNAVGGPAIQLEFREVEENRDECEAFLDRWFERTPWLTLGPFRDRAGQLERRPLHPYRLPERVPCVRIEDTLVVQPDGRVSTCDNDLDLHNPAGDLNVSSVEEIWTGERLSALRQAHGEGRWDAEPLCVGCDDWCRRG